MKVIKRSKRGYVEDPTKFFNFSRFADQASDELSLVEAAFEEAAGWEQFDLSDNALKKIKKSKVVRLEFEEPNKFFLGDNIESYDSDFYKVFTLCPYTASWMNEQQGKLRRIPIFFPFNEEYIPPVQDKIYDIIYTGHIVSKPVLKDIETIGTMNYRFVSNSNHRLVTNHKASYEEKMKLISQSKITLVHNLLYPRFYHIFNIWRYPNWQKNEAFKQIPNLVNLWRFFTDRKSIIVPQLKSRVFEAAFGRSLILCKKDPFNVIENYFVPDKEFVYYEDGRLKEKIEEIITNFDKYQPIIDRAFKRAQRDYTTKAFFKKYIQNLT